MTLRFRFKDENIGKKFEQKLVNQYNRIADASRTAMARAQKEIKTQGDADIKAGGNFGKRWTDSLNVLLEPARGRTVNFIISVFHTIPYASVFEKGATIRGKPLLWIPLSWTGIKIRAREYGRRFGLIYVERKDPNKNPLLLSERTKEPIYVGVEQVTLKKRFHLRQIVRRVARNIEKYYRSAYRNTRARK